ncbi:GGDEF domain-containing protein [Glaciecola sp. MF2-115]|uniref:GGDEF domain-containing protein n=1 Tax=Glaciecola sp. MF2-115 TaxID=3384827 RepID=UPI0039A38CFA
MEMTQTSKLLRRTSKDISQRSIAGILIYPIFWPLLAYGSDFDKNYPTTVLTLTILHIVISAVRLVHVYLHEKIPESSLGLWMKVSSTLVVSQGALWGLMFAVSLLSPNEQFQFFMTMSSAGVAAGGTNTFAPNKLLAGAFAIVLLLPTMVVTLYSQDYIVSAIILAYLFYIFGLSRNQYNEYWRSIKNELLLEKQSRTDSLTQLDNRRFFDEKLDELCHLSSRNHEILAVIVIDCDHFKSINDNYGHDVGDLCLKHIADTLKQALPRATDVCARYGGEEFSVLLPGTDKEGAIRVAERIRQSVEQTPLCYKKFVIEMTVSIGVTAHHINKFQPELPKELFKEADDALFQAKEKGRNRCVFYSE